MTKPVLVTALFITLFLLSTILLLGQWLGGRRADVIQTELTSLHNNLNDLQTFSLLSDSYGNQMACLAFDTKLHEMDRSIWDLGTKLDQYSAASEEFRKSQYYINQKQIFNENEVVYLSILAKLKRTCGLNRTIITYFYGNHCPDCDAQGAVLSAINNDFGPEVAIFSLDGSLNVTSIKLLGEYFNVTSEPCIVVDNATHCGLKTRSQVEALVCTADPHLSSCSGLDAANATTPRSSATR